MPIRVKCDSCKKTLSVKDHLAGKKIKCPVCQSVVAVSAASPAKPSAPTVASTPKSTTAPPKKPAAAPKPGVAVKPPVDKTKTNGTSAADHAKSNGKHEEPAIELPLENVEDAALEAFADEPKPAPVEDEAPQTIDFKCQWCDEDVKLPIEMAGKQAPCPNPECKRIIKVPLPKPVEKGDWRKMERQGPAAARINAPEALDNAWGTEEATKARQASLAQAGVIPPPPAKPRNWVKIGLYAVGGVLLVTFAASGIFSLRSSTQQTNAIKDASGLITGAEPKVKDPRLAAEVNRTLGLLFFRAAVRNPAAEARDQFQGAASRINEKDQTVDEQLFLIELALSQIELGGDGDDLLTKKKLPWKDVLPEVANTLRKIEDPEVQVLALREVGKRFVDKNQKELAVSVAGMLSNNAAEIKPPAVRQQMAWMSVLPGKEESLKSFGEMPDLTDDKNELTDGNRRVGYAEVMARKGNFEEALKLVKLKGPVRDQLDASLGIASVAWQDRNKDETNRFVKEAIEFLNDKANVPTPWQLLQLIQLAARVEDNDSLKKAQDRLPDGPFKLRAQLEMFRVQCDKSTSRIDSAKLADLEAADKEGVTLALAWMSLAEHNTRFAGASLSSNRKDLESRITILEVPPAMHDQIRGMVDIGTYRGSMK